MSLARCPPRSTGQYKAISNQTLEYGLAAPSIPPSTLPARDSQTLGKPRSSIAQELCWKPLAGTLPSDCRMSRRFPSFATWWPCFIIGRVFTMQPPLQYTAKTTRHTLLNCKALPVKTHIFHPSRPVDGGGRKHARPHGNLRVLWGCTPPLQQSCMYIPMA